MDDGRERRRELRLLLLAEPGAEAGQEEQQLRDGRQVGRGHAHLAQARLDGLGDVEDLAVGALEEGVQVGEGRGGLVLEAGEQPALDRAELGRAVAEVGLEWGVQMTISLHLEN